MSRGPKPLPTSPTPPALPRWIRQAVGRDDIETVMFSAGAALAALDPTARSEDPVGILWRKRLALAAAAAVSKLEGRREGEAQLRDAFALRKGSRNDRPCQGSPGETPGPRPLGKEIGDVKGAAKAGVGGDGAEGSRRQGGRAICLIQGLLGVERADEPPNLNIEQHPVIQADRPRMHCVISDRH